MKRWQYRSVSKCLQYGEEMEDKSHVTQCQQESSATQEFDRVIKKLKQWFRESNTAHEVAKIILWGLAQWQGGATDLGQAMLRSLNEQKALGDKFLDGWLVQSWHKYQEQLWLHGHSCQSGKHWWLSWLKSYGTFHGICGCIGMEFCTIWLLCSWWF